MMQNPWRVPQWRWLRANSVVDNTGPLPTPRRDGPDGYKWIRRAARFRRLYNQNDDEVGRCRLAMEFPAIFWAHYAWENNEQPMKWAIEAHILARETNKEIAFKVGCAPEIVEAYEAIFFHVREKLNFREYILNSVMSDAVTRGLSDRHYDLLWKLFGYSGGPHVLDAMIGKLVNPMWAARSDDVPSFFQDAALNIMKKKAAIASLTVPINSNTHLNLIEAFVKYVEIERTTDSMGKAQDQIVANLNSMLTMLPFGVGTKKSGQDKMLPAYDGTAIELHADELMVVGAGLNLPQQQVLTALEFPPPPRVVQTPAPETKDEDAKQGSGGENPQRERRRRWPREPGPEPE